MDFKGIIAEFQNKAREEGYEAVRHPDGDVVVTMEGFYHIKLTPEIIIDVYQQTGSFEHIFHEIKYEMNRLKSSE